MRNIGRDEGGFARGEDEGRSGDRELDGATQHDGDLLFGMAVDRKDGSGLVDVAHQGLVATVDGLPGDPRERVLGGDQPPVDGSGVGYRRAVQKTNQPQKSASASRKKKTLETPPPKMR